MKVQHNPPAIQRIGCRIVPPQSDGKYRVLLEITNAIVSNLDRDGLFRAIAQELQKVPTFDRTGITLYDVDEDHFHIFVLETTRSPVSLCRGADIPHQGSGMGWAFDHQQTLYRPTLPDTYRFFEDEHFLREGIRSVVYLPLITSRKTLGTFQVASRTAHRYSDEDLDFLSHVAKQIAMALENALAYEKVSQLQDRLSKENEYLREEIKSERNVEEIIGKSQAIQAVLEKVKSVAQTGATVLIVGETGTGKELIARAVHDYSHRKHRPLIKVNCAALPSGLVESELFGHEKGAFTGAVTRKIGRFELAHGGTIFLDEIGDIPQDIQAKLLRVLQEQEFERVGGTETKKVDVRVIAATNRQLDEAVTQQTFRADLFYRLNVFPIFVPPLRKRTDDISVLARYFVSRYKRILNKPIAMISPESMKRLIHYPWPGNIRELENVIERAMILCDKPVLDIPVEDAQVPPCGPMPSSDGHKSLEEIERTHILKVLEQTRGVIGGKHGAAEILKVHPNTLRGRLVKLGIKKLEDRTSYV